MNSGAYKDFYARDENGIAKRLPEPEYQRQNRKEKGLQHTSRILNMFDDEGQGMSERIKIVVETGYVNYG